MENNPTIREAHEDKELRLGAGWFEHTDVGIVRAKGNDALDLLNRLSTNELREVAIVEQRRKGKQTVLTSDKGRIVDILTVIPWGDSLWWLCSPGALMKTVQHIRKYIIMDDVKLADESADWAVIEIVGPAALQFLREVDAAFPAALQIAESVSLTMASVVCECVRMPSVCELSYYLFIPIAKANVVRDFLLSLHQTLPQLSKEEYEVLRIENGMGRYGIEWQEAYNPLEAGLLHLVNFKKGCYIGQEVIARLDSYNKVKQRIMGFRSQLPLNVGAIIQEEGKEVGRITSSVFSPLFGNIALGYIRNEYATEGRETTIVEESSSIKATISALPFRHP